MYPHEEWEEVEEASLGVLNPVVLEKERKSLWNNLKTLEIHLIVQSKRFEVGPQRHLKSISTISNHSKSMPFPIQTV